MNELQFGVFLSPDASDGCELRATVRAAEDAGFDRAFARPSRGEAFPPSSERAHQSAKAPAGCSSPSGRTRTETASPARAPRSASPAATATAGRKPSVNDAGLPSLP
jgi:hypothetical protein